MDQELLNQLADPNRLNENIRFLRHKLKSDVAVGTASKEREPQQLVGDIVRLLDKQLPGIAINVYNVGVHTFLMQKRNNNVYRCCSSSPRRRPVLRRHGDGVFLSGGRPAESRPCAHFARLHVLAAVVVDLLIVGSSF